MLNESNFSILAAEKLKEVLINEHIQEIKVDKNEIVSAIEEYEVLSFKQNIKEILVQTFNEDFALINEKEKEELLEGLTEKFTICAIEKVNKKEISNIIDNTFSVIRQKNKLSLEEESLTKSISLSLERIGTYTSPL